MLAESGFSQLSVDAICLRANVPRSTFYRRWSSALAVVVDAFNDSLRIAPLPDTGDLISDLVAFAVRIDTLFKDPLFGACLSFMTAEARLRPDLREHLLQDWTARRAANREIFHRAKARGQTYPDMDPELIFDVINGLAMTRRINDLLPKVTDYELVIRRLLGADGGFAEPPSAARHAG